MRPVLKLLPILGALLLALPALAQSPDSDPARLASARKYLEITHAADKQKNIYRLIVANTGRELVAANPGKEADIAALLKNMAATLDAQTPPVLEETAKVYARHFTQAELDQIVAFYETPVGAKLVAETPAMMAEQARETGDISQKVMAIALDNLKRKAAERGIKMPKGI